MGIGFGPLEGERERENRTTNQSLDRRVRKKQKENFPLEANIEHCLQ